MQHARPHLETHSRSKGHSAVAGAAYRLGLKLYDERAGIWHDFRKRELGEEIVKALTIAPPGSPPWASDPEILWNKVEAAEKRKDAQIARDYRIPIPFGLSDLDAGNLAEEMATFIAHELHTPVSIGLHRDADRDALGALKSKEKQGFHAHLYFPTRRLDDFKDGDGKAGSAGGFGAKLSMLSNKNTSTVFVEMLNAKWAELANRFTTASQLPADYDHRSYSRMGVNITPQLTLGRSATAMERRGITSNRGDSLREAKVMAQMFEKAHQTAVAAQHARAVADVARESGRKPKAPQRHPVRVQLPRNSGLKFDTRLGPIALRIRTMTTIPKSGAERVMFEKSLDLITIIEKALASIRAFEADLNRLTQKRDRTKAAALDATYQVDQSRTHLAGALRKVKQWERDHPWRVRVADLSGMKGMHPEQLRLKDQVKYHDGHVQAFKTSIKVQNEEALALGRELAEVKANRIEQEIKIRKSVAKLKSDQSGMLDQLRGALSATDRNELMLCSEHGTSAIEKLPAIVDTSVLKISPPGIKPN